MIYDLSKPLEKEAFKTRANHLFSKGKVVELTERMGRRTSSQNAYLHLILSYFALQYGESMEFVKRYFFKAYCNPTIFIIEKHDAIIGVVKVLRSSADLSTDEMTTAIERFKDWSAKEAGIYLPDAASEEEILEAQREIERQKRWI